MDRKTQLAVWTSNALDTAYRLARQKDAGLDAPSVKYYFRLADLYREQWRRLNERQVAAA